jgi:cyclophilin family peptidyl-prolyl cis-trans isomerase
MTERLLRPLAAFGLLLSAAWLPAQAETRLAMQTSHGPIVIELFDKQAPVTARNFVEYAESGFFDGIIFHRVIPGFVIQGGGFTADFERKQTRDPIPNEADNGLKNRRGTLSMARTAAPDSATSQFFINLVDNPSLDRRDDTPRGAGYAVFGRVVEGMETVDRIAELPTGPAGPFRRDAPRETVRIESVDRLEGGD